MKIINLFFVIMLMLFLAGCGSSRIVYLPQKCETLERTPPVKTGEVAVDVKNILIYTELLEKDLKFCKGIE